MRRFSSALSKPASAFVRSDLRGGFQEDRQNRGRTERYQ